MKTGIQLSSLCTLMTTPEQIEKAFYKISDLGCQCVQLQWIESLELVDDIVWSMKCTNMESLGSQDFSSYVQSDLDYFVNLNRLTGGIWLTVSRIPEDRKSPEGLDIFAGELEALQEKLTPLGQRVCFHPVSPDYNAVPGMNAVEYLLEKLPWLELCLDLYHLDKNCDDMPAFIRRYAGRIPMVHFKDHRNGRLVPAGSGEVRWAGVVKACLDAGVKYALAEQESWEEDPYECLGQAMAWIEGEISRG